MKPPHFTRFLSFLVLFALVLSGCDVLGGDDDTSLPEASGVIVANGGNFSDQNGHLTFHDPETAATVQGGSLAGFVQGVAMDGDRVLALINTFGPGRIDVMDESGQSTGVQWSGFDSPRDLVRVDDLIWVSTFAFGSPGNAIALAEDGSIARSVQVGEVPEGIAYWEGSVVVANNGSLGAGTTLSRIAASGGDATSVETGCDGPRDLFTGDDRLILVCSGKTVYSADFTQILETTPGQVVMFNEDFVVTDRIVLSGQAGSTNGTVSASYSEATDELFVMLSSSEQLVVIDVDDVRVTDTLDLSGRASLIGLSGVAYDAGRDQLYVGRFPVSSAGRFPDYAAAGTVEILSRDGTPISSFPAGASISSITLN